MRILALSDVSGRSDLLERLAHRGRDLDLAGVLCVGNLLPGGARLDEWVRARAEGRPPRRYTAAIAAQEPSDAQTLDAVFDALAALAVPVAFVPGDLDAPERLILQAANHHEIVTPNLVCVHRSFAFLPPRRHTYAVAGFGGLVTTGERETDLVLAYPAWEIKTGLDFLRRLDQELILLLHTPPRFGKLDLHRGEQVGSPVVEEIIHTLNPRLVVCGHAADGRAAQEVGKSLVVNPGSFCQGSYAVVDLATREVTFEELPGVVPAPTEADRALQEQVQQALAAEPATREGRIGVVVRGGIARLVGSVRTLAMKAAAQRVAEAVPGVERVENALTADTALVARVTARLAEDPRTALAPIDVSALGGEVTLSGAVTSPRVKQAAEEIARSIPGVVVVLNELRVETPEAKTSTG